MPLSKHFPSQLAANGRHDTPDQYRPTLLVVDDEPEITVSLADHFRHIYHVMTATSADEALTVLKKHEVSVIVADQRMPGKTGAELLAEACFLDSDTVRILLTAYADLEAVIQAVNEGKIFYYLQKPWRDDELNAVIAKAFEHNRLLTERRGLVADLRRINTELCHYRDHLEQLVTERTSELATANERLKEVDRLKAMFIASVSHELRTPLNSIIGYSSVMINEWTGPLNEEQKSNMNLVLKAGQHLLTLINDIIDMSKVEAGQVDVFVDEFDLYDLCMEASGLMAEEARTKGLSFTMEPHHHPMHTDRRRLLQCLLNLIGNAVKYTESGSVSVGVDVTSQEPDQPAKVLFSVADTGIGVAPGDRSKLFIPFVRIESPLKELVSGTGLGLYMTRRISELTLGGDVWHQENQGGGSVFKLSIPDRSKAFMASNSQP